VITRGDVGETYCVGGLTKQLNNLSIMKKIIEKSKF